MNGGISFWQLILNASLPVQGIMLLLLLASLTSWTVIIAKRALLARIQSAAVAFENRFWAGGSMNDLYEGLRRGGRESDEGLPTIFRAGYEEFTRQQSSSGRLAPDDALAAVQRQMRVAQARESEKLEGGLSLLATVASASPYVGLFGTVYGIMNAFIAIGNVKQASLAQVAPGIAEALIATAIGLFAAIPAQVAYNFLVARVDSIEGRFSVFTDEMLGIVERGLRGQAAQRGV